MNKILTVYKQQEWTPQINVEIREGMSITLNGIELKTKNEVALANIIFRLNGYRKNEEENKIVAKKEFIDLMILIGLLFSIRMEQK